MALFASKKNTDSKKTKDTAVAREPKAVARASRPTVPSSLALVLRRPRITEKAANLTTGNVYTFDIGKAVTKREVREAIKALYKVTPVKVNVVNTPAAKVRLRQKRGFGKAASGRKAYVFLKKGDEIQLA